MIVKTQRHPPALLYGLWYAFVFSLAFTDLVFLPDVFHDSLQISTILLILLVAGLVAWVPRSRARLTSPDLPSAFLYLFFAFAAFSVLESIWSPLQEYRGERLWDKGIRQVLALSICVGTYAVTMAMARTRPQIIKSLVVYAATLAPATVAGFLDMLNFYAPTPASNFLAHTLHRNVLVAPAQIYSVVVPRFQLLAFEPSMAGNYLLSVVPIAFALLAVGHERIKRSLILAAGIVGAFLFVGTLSLGAFLAGWVELLCFVAVGRLALPWKRVLQIGFLAAIGLAVATAVPTRTSPQVSSNPPTAPPATENRLVAEPTAPPATENRLVGALSESASGGQDVSNSWRLIMLETALNTFKDHPLVGVGWGNSQFYVLQEFPASGWQHPMASAWTDPGSGPASTTAANNMVARVLAETGLIGGLLFILWHTGVAMRGLAALRAREPLALGLAVAWAGIVAHYAALSGLDKRYWYFLPAMIVAISGLESVATKRARRQAKAAATHGHARPVGETSS